MINERRWTMNGLLVIDKPAGMTSHDVVSFVRRTLKTKRVGHTGTLDPDATGVLVVAIGDATKGIRFFEENDKVYDCTITIGISTDTEDASGIILEEKKVEPLDNQMVDDVLESLIGRLDQIPPMYSSVKIDGKKMYEYARQQIEIEREAKSIQIFAIKRTSELSVLSETLEFSFETRVSKGTYVRTLCVEIGSRLGYPAHMKRLVRLTSGNFSLRQAISLDRISAGDFQLLPLLSALEHHLILEADDAMKQRIGNGMKIELENDAERIVFVDCENTLLAIYDKMEKNQYKAVRVWK